MELNIAQATLSYEQCVRPGFEACLLDWQGRLGLTDWDIHVEPAPLDGANAYVRMHDEANKAFVLYRPDLPEACWDATAVHELMHLFLRDYTLRSEDGSKKRLKRLRSLEEQLVYRLARSIVTLVGHAYDTDWATMRPED